MRRFFQKSFENFRSKFFDEIPDIHQKRFPDDREGTSFAIEALAIKE